MLLLRVSLILIILLYFFGDLLFSPSYQVNTSGTVLVTGAGKGIGAATVVSILRACSACRVVAAFRRANANDEARLVAQLSAAERQRLDIVGMDIVSDGEIATVVDKLREEKQSLIGLVNNAGTSIARPLELEATGEGERVVEVNLLGSLKVTRHMLPLLRKSKGRIVFVGSGTGEVALKYYSYYSASKFALRGAADALRYELRPLQVHVSLVEPGLTRTSLTAKALGSNGYIASFYGQMSASQRELYGDFFKLENVNSTFESMRFMLQEPTECAQVIVEQLFSPRPRAKRIVLAPITKQH